MKKKIIKAIENTIPRVFDEDGEEISKRKIAEKIYDKLDNPERLDLQPFEMFIPTQCSSCFYNEGRKMGCTYLLYNENKHQEFLPPENCPYDY